MRNFILINLILTWSCLWASGFDKGNVYKVLTLNGSVEVWCPSSLVPQYVSCKDRFFLPSSKARFIYKGDRSNLNSVQKVSLTNIDSGAFKEKHYSLKHNRSNKFNLLQSFWIFRRPLLVLGDNLIKFKLKNKRNTLDCGYFSVTVLEEERQCPHKVIHSNYDEDCEGWNICSSYYKVSRCFPSN